MSLQKKFELGDLSKILKLVPEKRQEGEKYIRAEKDGYYSLLTDNGASCIIKNVDVEN